MTENPVQPGALTNFTQLAAGRAVLFRLENDAGEKLNLEFQNETPLRAVAGTSVRHCGLAVRLARPADLVHLEVAVRALSADCPGRCARFLYAVSNSKIIAEFPPPPDRVL